MTQIIGDVAQIALRFYRDSDLNFDIVWWADPLKTEPRAISSAGGSVKEGWEGAELLDLADFITVLGNTASVSIPAASINALVTDGTATYHIWLNDGVDQERVMMGMVMIGA